MKLFSLEKSKSNTITCEDNCCCDLLIPNATGHYQVIINDYHYMTMF